MSKNRREFFRVMFHQGMDGKISIYGGNFLPIEIYNVSAGGLLFSSPLNIPLEESVNCSWELLDSAFSLDGSIVRKSTGTDKVEYGVEFSVDQGTFTELFQQLNYYQIRQRKGLSAE